jgi:hypothetical protein
MVLLLAGLTLAMASFDAAHNVHKPFGPSMCSPWDVGPGGTKVTCGALSARDLVVNTCQYIAVRQLKCCLTCFCHGRGVL